MATRFYLPASGSAPVAPSFNAYWNDTEDAASLTLVGAKSNTALTNITDDEAVTTNPVNSLCRQFVSEPLPAQTITGNITAVIRGLESSATADSFLTLVIYAVNQAGTTVRGVAYAGVTAALNTTAGALGQEWVTTAATRIIPSTALTSVTLQANDRIVVEIGSRYTNTVATAFTNTLRFGDPNATADFALTAALTTDLCPWIEFSQTLLFPATATLVDDFSTDKTATLWPASFGDSISGGVAMLTDPGAAYASLDTGSGYLYDLTGSYFFAKMQTPTGGVGAYCEFTLTEGTQADGQACQFEWTAGTLTMRARNAGYGDIDTSATLAVSAGNVIWCGYAEGTGASQFGGVGTAGNLYFYTSTNGTIWTLQKTTTSANKPAWLTKCRPLLSTHNTSGTTLTVFDNVNVVPPAAFVRSATDSSSPSDAAVRSALARTRTATDTSSPSDTAVRSTPKSRSMSDSSSPSDTANRALLAHTRTATDSSTPSDAAGGPGGFARAAADSSTPSDVAQRTFTRSRTAVDSSSPTDAAPRSMAPIRTASDSSSPSDATVRSPLANLRTATDASSPSDVAGRPTQALVRTATDSTAPADAAVRASLVRTRTAADSSSSTDTAVGTGKGQVTASDISVPSDSVGRSLGLVGRTASDASSPSDTAGRSATEARSASDNSAPTETAGVTVHAVRTATDLNAVTDVAIAVVGGGPISLFRTAADASAPSDSAHAVLHTATAAAAGSPASTLTVRRPVGSTSVRNGHQVTLDRVLATLTPRSIDGRAVSRR